MRAFIVFIAVMLIAAPLWAEDQQDLPATPPDSAVAEEVVDSDETESNVDSNEIAETIAEAADTAVSETAPSEQDVDAGLSTARVEPAADSAHQYVESAKRNADALTTELTGLDTLGIVPDEVVTHTAGGTRRVTLENTVFRREDPVIYDPAGNRDPFRALLVDEKKEGEIETDLLRLEGAVLRGVVWSDGQYLALVSDKDNKSFVLREGELVFKGRVLSVTQSQVVFEVSDFGDYDQVTLRVKR